MADQTPTNLTERRTKPRIPVAYPALVRGDDTTNDRFQEEALVDNVSAGGLYLRVKHPVTPGSSLFITLRFSSLPPKQAQAPCLAALAMVLRADDRQDGTCGLALKFQRHRFLDCNECNCEFKKLD